MRDAAATRRRILDAAATEFSVHGLAGARVDRIAVEARCNKAQLYAYFGNKEQLFETVLAEHVAANLDRVPLDVDDLPGYAVRLYDDYVADPLLVRLATFARLERVPVGALFPDDADHHQRKIAPIAGAQRAGRLVGGIAPDHLFSLVIAMSGTWAQASLTETAGPDDPDHASRRAALAASVRRAFVPAG